MPYPPTPPPKKTMDKKIRTIPKEKENTLQI